MNKNNPLSALLQITQTAIRCNLQLQRGVSHSILAGLLACSLFLVTSLRVSAQEPRNNVMQISST